MDSHNVKGAITIEVSEFTTTCLELMDEVARSGEEIVITKNGRPVSRLVPFRDNPTSLFGTDKGRIEILADIITPVNVEEKATIVGSGTESNDSPRHTPHAVAEAGRSSIRIQHFRRHIPHLGMREKVAFLRSHSSKSQY